MAFADVKQGVDAWEQGDYESAIKQWREPALKGDADAQFNLGQAYKLGRGVTMDLETAQDWFRRAAEQGHRQAIDNYGLILFQTNKREEAMPFIKASAARGEPRAQYVLGTSYFNGDLVEKDWVRAYALMTRSAASGLPQASRSLAAMDKYLSLEERQKAMALAEQIDSETAAERIRLASAAPISGAAEAPPSPAVRSAVAKPPKPIRPAVLPPSRVASAQTTGKADHTANVAPNESGHIGASFAQATPSATATDIVSASPKTAPAAVAAPQTVWHVQLGAFSSRQRAEQLWSALPGKFPGLGNRQPAYVPAGKLTKLQAGPFASREEAAKFCEQLGGGGQPCFPVK